MSLYYALLGTYLEAKIHSSPRAATQSSHDERSASPSAVEELTPPSSAIACYQSVTSTKKHSHKPKYSKVFMKYLVSLFPPLFPSVPPPSSGVDAVLHRRWSYTTEVVVLDLTSSYLGNGSLIGVISFAAKCCPLLETLNLCNQNLYNNETDRTGTAAVGIASPRKAKYSRGGSASPKSYTLHSGGGSSSSPTGNEVISHLSAEFCSAGASLTYIHGKEHLLCSVALPCPLYSTKGITIDLQYNDIGDAAGSDLFLLARRDVRITRILCSVGTLVSTELTEMIESQCKRNAAVLRTRAAH